MNKLDKNILNNIPDTSHAAKNWITFSTTKYIFNNFIAILTTVIFINVFNLVVFNNLHSMENIDTATAAKTNLPTIHIRRKQTGSHESNPIKVLWDLCVLDIETKKTLRDRFPKIWSRTLESIKRRQADFNLDRGIAPEPNWSGLTENYKDEYFSGDKYALYSKGKTYKVSKNGSCELIKKYYHRAKIDDGNFSYKVDFEKK